MNGQNNPARTRQFGLGRVFQGGAALLVLVGAAVPALAQTNTPAATPAPAPATADQAASPALAPSTGDPTRDNFIRMGRRITIKFEQQRLEDVMKYLSDFTGADIEPMWKDEHNTDGLDPDETLTLSVKNVSALTLLETVLEKAQLEDAENTWQVDKYGAIQAGPKSRLNKFKRTEIYDINDLLLELPRYDQVPTIDLQSVLQSGQGGGGQSPFKDDNSDTTDKNKKTVKEKADEVVALIEKIVESPQWVDNGGEAGSIDQFRGTLIVTAPDYIHRQINGYPWWPSERTTSGMAGGRRYVSLDVDTGLSTVDGFANQPVTAVVGGQLVPSGPGGGR